MIIINMEILPANINHLILAYVNKTTIIKVKSKKVKSVQIFTQSINKILKFLPFLPLSSEKKVFIYSDIFKIISRLS